jgi:hypothetical protein
VTLTPAFLPLAESITQPSNRDRLSYRDRDRDRDRDRGADISDVLAVCDVLSPVRNLELLYSSETFEKDPLSRGKEPLRYLYLPKSHSSHQDTSSSAYPSSSSSTQGTSSPPNDSHNETNPQEAIENPEFQFGLSLLQANILVLCIKSGVDPRSLYPPEAMLLNLDLLQQQAIQHISLNDLSHTASSTTTATESTDDPNTNDENLFQIPLPESLQRVVDPYPALDLEQVTIERDTSSSIEVEDGIYVFSDDEIHFEDQSFGQSPELICGGEGSDNGGSPSRRRSSSQEICSPVREYEEKIDDGQEWSFVSEMTERGRELDSYYSG